MTKSEEIFREPTEGQGQSFVGSTGVRAENLTGGTSKAEALCLRRDKPKVTITHPTPGTGHKFGSTSEVSCPHPLWNLQNLCSVPP